MQYFIGLSGFEMKAPFHHSMMTHFRKRLVNVLAEINELVATEGAKAESGDDDNNSNSGTSDKTNPRSKHAPSSRSSDQQEWTFEEDVQRKPDEPPASRQT